MATQNSKPDEDGEVAVPVAVARNILRILDGLGDAGVMGYRGDEAFEPACDPVPEAAELAQALYKAMRPLLRVGDQVTDGVKHGKIVALVLFTSGWEAHIAWDETGIGISTIDVLAPTE